MPSIWCTSPPTPSLPWPSSPMLVRCSWEWRLLSSPSGTSLPCARRAWLRRHRRAGAALYRGRMLLPHAGEPAGRVHLLYLQREVGAMGEAMALHRGPRHVSPTCSPFEAAARRPCRPNVGPSLAANVGSLREPACPWPDQCLGGDGLLPPPPGFATTVCIPPGRTPMLMMNVACAATQPQIPTDTLSLDATGDRVQFCCGGGPSGGSPPTM